MANGKIENGVTDGVVSLAHATATKQGNPEAVPTVAPISDADGGARAERRRLEAERAGGILCVTVCEDGLRAGNDWPKCTGPLQCIESGGCFWRRWHGIPDHQMRRNCDVVLD